MRVVHKKEDWECTKKDPNDSDGRSGIKRVVTYTETVLDIICGANVDIDPLNEIAIEIRKGVWLKIWISEWGKVTVVRGKDLFKEAKDARADS